MLAEDKSVDSDDNIGGVGAFQDVAPDGVTGTEVGGKDTGNGVLTREVTVCT